MSQGVGSGLLGGHAMDASTDPPAGKLFVQGVSNLNVVMRN